MEDGNCRGEASVAAVKSFMCFSRARHIIRGLWCVRAGALKSENVRKVKIDADGETQPATQ